MKILLLNQAFYPDVVSTAQHMHDLAAELTERGHKVTVVTSRRAYDKPNRTFAAREELKNLTILRVWSTGFGKAAKWRRIGDFASFMLSAGIRLLFIRRHDAVIALTTPPLISVLGALRAKLWGGKFFYWVMDLNPDEAIAAGWLAPGSRRAAMLERLSVFSFRSAAKIIALDRFMRDRILAKGVSSKNIALVPPWSHDLHVKFDPQRREEFRSIHRMGNRFVVMYSGNHSPVHPLDTLMRTIELLEDDPSFLFCFIGGGSEFVRVRTWAEAGKLSNVLCLPYQPIDMLSSSLSAADAHVVVMGNPFVGMVHPCKIYNILTVGAPVIYIGPSPSHVTEIFSTLSKTYRTITANHGDSEYLAIRIRELAARPQTERKPEGTAFSKDHLLPRMLSVIEST